VARMLGGRVGDGGHVKQMAGSGLSLCWGWSASSCLGRAARRGVGARRREAPQRGPRVPAAVLAETCAGLPALESVKKVLTVDA
jgi:hypothetical protein